MLLVRQELTEHAATYAEATLRVLRQELCSAEGLAEPATAYRFTLLGCSQCATESVLLTTTRLLKSEVL